MAIIGYVRVSTNEQTVTNQKQVITEKGYNVGKWFSDEGISGSVEAAKRQGFSSLLGYVREGDQLIVVGIDRLGRNTIDVLETVKTLQGKGVQVISIREGFDLGTPVGKAMLTVMAGLAQLEKDLIAERRTAGIKRAQSEGVHCGRPVKVTPGQVRALISAGMSPSEVQRELGISKATYYRLRMDL